MLKIASLLLAMTLSTLAFAESKEETQVLYANLEAKAIKLAHLNIELSKFRTEALRNGCVELKPNSTLVGSVSYGFSAEDYVLVIDRYDCNSGFSHSSIRTISALAILKQDDTGIDNSKMLVNPINLNDMVLQNQLHKRTK